MPAAKKTRNKTIVRTPTARRVKSDDSVPANPGIEKLEALIAILERSGLTELEYGAGDLWLRVAKHEPIVSGSSVAYRPASEGALAPSPVTSPAPVAAPVIAASPTPAPAEKAEDLQIHIVRSPFVGTFYSAPSPNSAPFARIGERVSATKTICIIEAMKLMNEIPAEVDGVVEEILAENGQPVQYGEALIRLRTGK
jgi:acetyl-CoA carboxylase biotin carboxyl carrier protein